MARFRSNKSEWFYYCVIVFFLGGSISFFVLRAFDGTTAQGTVKSVENGSFLETVKFNNGEQLTFLALQGDEPIPVGRSISVTRSLMGTLRRIEINE